MKCWCIQNTFWDKFDWLTRKKVNVQCLATDDDLWLYFYVFLFCAQNTYKNIPNYTTNNNLMSLGNNLNTDIFNAKHP